MDEKLKKRKHAKKSSFLCLGLCYILIAIRAGRCRERRYVDHIIIQIHQNAPFRSQIFIVFFASGGKGAVDPLAKILRTFLINRFRYFMVQMLLKEYAISRFFSFPPRLTNVSALPVETLTNWNQMTALWDLWKHASVWILAASHQYLKSKMRLVKVWQMINSAFV